MNLPVGTTRSEWQAETAGYSERHGIKGATSGGGAYPPLGASLTETSNCSFQEP